MSKTTRWFSGLNASKKVWLGLASLVVGIFGLTAIGSSHTHQQPARPNIPIVEQKTGSNSETLAEKTEKKQVVESQAISYTSSSQNDPTLNVGTEEITVSGVNGERAITYEVTYKGGVETGRTQVSNIVTKQPVNEVKAVGTKPVTQSSSSAGSSCSGGYINTYGNCVPSPSNDPTGATAKCRDGSYSYSQSRSGTCSHHGGVAAWL